MMKSNLDLIQFSFTERLLVFDTNVLERACGLGWWQCVAVCSTSPPSGFLVQWLPWGPNYIYLSVVKSYTT